MVVISQLLFRKYLDNLTSPVEIAAAAGLPSVRALPAQQVDRECDVLMINRQQGIIVGEVKSVGGGDYFQSQPENRQNDIIMNKVEKAVTQVSEQETALRHLVSDLNITIRGTLIFPNLTSVQLVRALINTSVAQVSVFMSVLLVPIVSPAQLLQALTDMPVAQVSVFMSMLLVPAVLSTQLSPNHQWHR